MYICPHCEEGIDRVDYKVPQTEFGYVSLPEGRENPENVENNLDCWESQETDNHGDYEFFCPECSHGLDLSQLRWEDDTANPFIPTQTAIIDEQETIRPAFVGEGRRNQFDVTMICMKTSCKKPFIYDKNEGRFFECPYCHFNNDKQEFDQKIRQGDYNLEKRHA